MIHRYYLIEWAEMRLYADLCAALFATGSRLPSEADIAAHYDTTVDQVRTFYSALAGVGLLKLYDEERRIWVRTEKAAHTVVDFLQQVRREGFDLSASLAPGLSVN